MGFLQRVHGVTLWSKVHSSEIPKSRSIKPLFWIKRFSATMVYPCV